MTSPFDTASDALRSLVLQRVDEFRSVAGISDSTVSRRAVGEAEFVTRLRGGENVTLGKVRRLEKFLNHELHLVALRAASQRPSAASDLPAVVSPCA